MQFPMPLADHAARVPALEGADGLLGRTKKGCTCGGLMLDSFMDLVDEGGHGKKCSACFRTYVSRLQHRMDKLPDGSVYGRTLRGHAGKLLGAFALDCSLLVEQNLQMGHLPCSRENEMIHVTMQKLPNIQMFVHILQDMVQDNHRCSLKHTVHVVMTKCAAWSKQRSLQQCFVRQQCFLCECDSYGLFPFLEFLLAACANSTGQPPI